MALKFLNKKGWHTGSLRNIENVWKAEQKHEAEKKKLDELRKQIGEERERQEFRQLQQKAGLAPKQERLDFLYESGLGVGKPSTEEYLLGKPFEEAKEENVLEQAAAQPGALFVEEKPQSANETWRKIHSDPLLLIKQQEQALRDRIKSNPVKMEQIRKDVEVKKKAKEEKKRLKGERKEAKRKEKKRKKMKAKRKEQHSDDESEGKKKSDSESDDERNKRREVKAHRERRRSDDSDSDDDKKGNKSNGEGSSYGRGRRKTYDSDSDDGKNQRRKITCSEKKREGSDDESRDKRKDMSSYGLDERKSGQSYGRDEMRRSYGREERRSYGGEEKRPYENGNRLSRDSPEHREDSRQKALSLHRKPPLPRNIPKLTEEEKMAKLKQMQMDAEQHEEERWQRLKRASVKDAVQEEKDSVRTHNNFLKETTRSMYGADAEGSIEDTLKRKVHYREKFTDTNAFRRT